jgi:CO/xanthine dehydrogenase FAD-binding subunit
MAVLIPATLAEAVSALSERPDAVVLAGGTDLMVDVNEGRHHLGAEQLVMCVNRVPELRSWTLDRAAGALRLGAAVTYAELAAEPLAGLLPALAQAARTVGSPQIRNAATVGGNVVTCSPAGDGLPVLAALDATVELASAEGVRRLPIAELMVGVKRTSLRPDELLVAIDVPLLHGWQGYAKVGVRNAMVIAISGACLALDEPSRSVRLALGSVAPTIVRAVEAEAHAAAAIEWDKMTISAEALAGFGELAAAASSPIDDHRSTAAYRRHSIGVLALRLLRRAVTITGAEAVPA